MGNTIDFTKKFSIGLTLSDSLATFTDFIVSFSWCIESCYFSLPLGDRFHSRIGITNSFHHFEAEQLFLDEVNVLQRLGISLEVLFNTDSLSDDDLISGVSYLNYHNIEVNSVGMIDKYYPTISQLLPNKCYVYSFNNFPQSNNEFFDNGHQYDRYVVGRKFIRDYGLLKSIQQKKKKRVLLLNNGCSHTCQGCKYPSYCHEVYQSERASKTPEELYAIQSIMPFELNNGFISLDDGDIFKVANRNGNIDYTMRCLLSYINNNDRELIEKSKNDYFLWSRLSWQMPYFDDFDYNTIIAIKEKLYSRI